MMLLNILLAGPLDEVFYPEYIFKDLLIGHTDHDLLTLENLLVQSVDVILLFPESPGSIAELGAFVNNEKLRTKLICVGNIKHKKSKSFINIGPMKLLRKKSKFKKCVFCADHSNIANDFDKILTLLKQVKKNTSVEINNLIHIPKYLLQLIYLFEPITKESLEKFVHLLTKSDQVEVDILIQTALSVLINEKLIIKNTRGIELSKLGYDQFYLLSKKNNSKNIYNTKKIDEVRFKILNWKYRQK